MPWMPVVSEENAKGSVAIGAVVATGIIVMIVVGIPLDTFVALPAALLVALGLRYWHSRRKVDLIQLGYKDHPPSD